MGVLNVVTEEPGLVGVIPRIVRIRTTDNFATITGNNYLKQTNNSTYSIYSTDVLFVTYGPDTGTSFGIFTPTLSNGSVTMIPWISSSDVTLPVVSGDFSNFDGISGRIKDAGYSASNPALAKVTMFSGTSANNALAVFADTAGTLKPASTTATLGFGLTCATGNLTATAGNIVGGNSAGGNNANMQLFPTTAAAGSTRWIAAANGGNFTVDFTNASHGQSTVYTVADIGASTGGIPVATSAIKMKSVAGAAAAGGAAAQTFTDAFCTTGSNVIGNWNTQANAASVLKIVPGNGSFVVTSSADAGAGTFNYMIIK